MAADISRLEDFFYYWTSEDFPATHYKQLEAFDSSINSAIMLNDEALECQLRIKLQTYIDANLPMVDEKTQKVFKHTMVKNFTFLVALQLKYKAYQVVIDSADIVLSDSTVSSFYPDACEWLARAKIYATSQLYK